MKNIFKMFLTSMCCFFLWYWIGNATVIIIDNLFTSLNFNNVEGIRNSFSGVYLFFGIIMIITILTRCLIEKLEKEWNKCKVK